MSEKKHNLMKMCHKNKVMAECYFDENGEYRVIEYPDGKPQTEEEKLPRMDRIMRYGK